MSLCRRKVSFRTLFLMEVTKPARMCLGIYRLIWRPKLMAQTPLGMRMSTITYDTPVTMILAKTDRGHQSRRGFHFRLRDPRALISTYRDSYELPEP